MIYLAAWATAIVVICLFMNGAHAKPDPLVEDEPRDGVDAWKALDEVQREKGDVTWH